MIHHPEKCLLSSSSFFCYDTRRGLNGFYILNYYYYYYY